MKLGKKEDNLQLGLGFIEEDPYGRGFKVLKRYVNYGLFTNQVCCIEIHFGGKECVIKDEAGAYSALEVMVAALDKELKKGKAKELSRVTPFTEQELVHLQDRYRLSDIDLERMASMAMRCGVIFLELDSLLDRLSSKKL